MKQDARQQDVRDGSGSNAATQHAPRPAPGKVTRTSRLPGGGGAAVQRQALAQGAAPSGARSSLASLDAEMDAAHRGLAALSSPPAGQAVQRQQAPQGGAQGAQAAGPAQAPAGAVASAVDIPALCAELRFAAPTVNTTGNTLGIADALNWVENVQQRLHEAVQVYDGLPADHAERTRLGTAIATGAEQAAGHMTTMANTIRTQVEAMLRTSSPVAGTPPEGDTPAQPPPQATLPGTTEVDRLRTAAAGLSRAAHGTSSAMIESVRQTLASAAGSVADAALSIYQGLGVLSARADWVTGYRQDSLSRADTPTQAAAERELRRRQGARDGLNAVFADSGFNRYGVQPLAVGNSWEPHDWCGMFVSTHLFRSPGLDGELRAGFLEVSNVNDFFHYTQQANANRIPVTVWVPEENRWMELREYHRLRGSERTWTPRATIQAEIQAGRAPFRSGDVCLINHHGGNAAQHIVMVDSYDATTGELRTIEGNTLGIRSNAEGMAARNRQGELAVDSGESTVGIHIRQMHGTAERREGRGAYQNRAGNTVLGSGRLSVVDFEDHRYSTMPIGSFPAAARQLSPEQMNAATARSSHVARAQGRGPSSR